MQYPEAMSFYIYHTSSKPYSINGSSSARNLELHKLWVEPWASNNYKGEQARSVANIIKVFICK